MGRILQMMRRVWRALKVRIEKEHLRNDLYNRVYGGGAIRVLNIKGRSR